MVQTYKLSMWFLYQNGWFNNIFTRRIVNVYMYTSLRKLSCILWGVRWEKGVKIVLDRDICCHTIKVMIKKCIYNKNCFLGLGKQ